MDGERFEILADRLAALPVPKIAAMNGSAYGGGVEIGLCCDFRIGVHGMTAVVPAARFGLCYPGNGIRRYVNTLGPGPAKRLLVAAETLDAQELVQIGYLHKVTGQSQLTQEVDRWAQRLAGLAPLAVRAMLRACDQAASGNWDDHRVREWMAQCDGSDDLQEGLRAAAEKRPPAFRGR
jgi:enoyl-CoA hydratase/carnithine racemase